MGRFLSGPGRIACLGRTRESPGDTPIYWADWGWADPEVRGRYLACARWAQDNNLPTPGHCIIYPGWKFMPAGVRTLADDPPVLRQRLLEQVIEMTKATRPFKFAEYDVTNELRQLTELPALLGREVVVEWFKTARTHAPDSRMAVNENTILTRAGATEAFTMWGFWEGRMWQPPGAMVRKDWTLKPNGKVWMDLVLKEWWTDVDGHTGADGIFATRGFLGDYLVSVKVSGRGKLIPLKLEKSGTAATLALE